MCTDPRCSAKNLNCPYAHYVTVATVSVITVDVVGLVTPFLKQDKLYKREGDQIAIPTIRKERLTPEALHARNDAAFAKHLSEGLEEETFVPVRMGFRKERLHDTMLKEGQRIVLRMYSRGESPLAIEEGSAIVLNGVEMKAVEGYIPILSCQNMVLAEEHTAQIRALQPYAEEL